jgi:hypothetical protein
MGPGAPSDIGPDGGVLPPDAMGPDGLPMGGAEMGPDGEPLDDEGFPPDEMDDEEGGPPEDLSGPPGAADDEDADDEPPPPKKKDKGKSKKGSLTTYHGLNGEVLTESQFIRHLAATLSGGHPAVMAQLRAEAEVGPHAHYPSGPEPGAGHYCQRCGQGIEQSPAGHWVPRLSKVPLDPSGYAPVSPADRKPRATPAPQLPLAPMHNPRRTAAFHQDARGHGSGASNPDQWPTQGEVVHHVLQRHPEIHDAFTPEAADAAHRSIHEHVPEYLDHAHHDQAAVA